MKALVTFAVGDQRQLLNLSLPTFTEYAARHNYDLRVAECESEGRPPAWGKIPALLKLLCDFEQVLWLDADTLVVDVTEDLAAGVPTKAAQALLIEDHGVPNTGVWLVRRSMGPQLRRAWQSTQFIKHPWWEQAAIAHVMGLRVSGCSVKPPVKPTALYRSTHQLARRWNSFNNEHNKPTNHTGACIVHATGRGTANKLKRMRAWLKLEGSK